MDKILELALKSAKINTAGLLKVFNATGNMQVAAEIALGIYEYPEINHQPSDYIKANYHEALYKDYDPFKDEVSFTYLPAVHQQGWVPIDTKVPTTDDIVCSSTYANSAASDLGISTEELEAQYKKVTIVTNIGDHRRESSCSLKSWTIGY